MGRSPLTVPEIHRLSTYDRHCLRVETAARPVHVGVLAVLDGRALLDPAGRLRLDDLRLELDRRVARVPRLRWIVHHAGLLAGPPLWVDDPDFRIDRHVEAIELAAPGDEAALLALVERLMAPTLDRAHPLWHIWWVTGLTDARVALLVVLHHALADGLTAMRMVRSLFGPPAADGGRGPGAAAVAVAPPPWHVLVVDNLRSMIRSVRAVARPATWRLFAQAVRYVLWADALSRDETPSSLNAPVGPRRRMFVLRLDLPVVKRVARAGGCGANEVVLALVSGGVRALLAGRGEPVAALRARAGVAVALFSPDHEGEAGNDIGSLLVALPVAEPDPAARLPLLAVEVARAKQNPMVALEPVLRARLSRLAGRRSMERQRLVNVSETYLPGPPSPIEVLGAPVLELVPIAPLAGNLGLSFVALSYAGRLTVAVRADADHVPDLDLLGEALEQDWRALAATTQREGAACAGRRPLALATATGGSG